MMARLPDPHSVSAELDDATSAAIVRRLEGRARDAVFGALFESYEDEIVALGDGARVVEVGAGTGVLGRRLWRKGFRGLALGVDQSPFFIREAQQLAAEEAVGESVAFAVADARELKRDLEGHEPFDVLVMHTLISHVDDPLHVLRAAREVVRPGARLIIVDGDYPGLTYGLAGEAAGVAVGEMERAMVQVVFASHDVVRRLPELLAKSGWGDVEASGLSVSEVGRSFSYWRSFAEAYLPRVKQSGLVDAERADAWWEAQRRAAEAGTFFGACTYYTFRATAT